VLFIHAAGGWSETWRHAMTAAAERGFHAIAADLPPLGYSERPVGGDYRTQTQARRLIALLDALGVSRVTLVGHSFGSRTTVEVALLATERVRALTLVSAALVVAPEGAPKSEPSPLLRDLLERPRLREAAIGLTLSNPSCTRWIFERFVADPAVATDEVARVYARPLAVTGTTRALGEWLKYFLTVPDTSLGSDRASYARLRMPTLLVWGERDTTTPLPRGEYLKTLIPGSQLVVMKEIGHMAPQESPAAFDAILLDFLARFGKE
jgi:pimeloyl-ACP methyl ester carboxylesterase